MIPLILLPGLLCDDASWIAQKMALADLAIITIVDHGDANTIQKMAAAVLDRAPPRFAVAGHSMGGRVALEIVRKAPEKVLALALLDTGYQARPAGTVGEQEEGARIALLAKARSEGMREMALQWIPKMVHPDRLQDATFLEEVTRMVERKTPDIFERQIHALLHRPDAETLLGLIACPTLLLCGREDTWSPLGRHRLMAERIAGSTLEVVDDCGHMSMMERPDAVSAAMRRWLSATRVTQSERTHTR